MNKSFISLILVAVLVSLFVSPTHVEARKKNLKNFGGAILGTILDRERERVEERERIRRQEERERSRIRMEEERNASRIRQAQERREELARREALKDLQFQQELELERERQERERQMRKQLQNPQPAESSAPQATFNPDGSVEFQGKRFANPQDFANWLQSQTQKTGEKAPREVEMNLYPSGACRIHGIEKTFSSTEEALAHLSQIWPRETIQLRVYKCPAPTSL